MKGLIQKQLQDVINHALEEDIGQEDVTTNAIIDSNSTAEVIWVAKQDGIVAGLNFAKEVFARFDENLDWYPKVKDGAFVETGDVIVSFEGNCRAVLSGERIALNIAQRLSGIASATFKMVDLVKDLPVKILDTRKTVPGFRFLDKYAVKAGGGENHRMGLYDMAMIKDNHIVAAGGIIEAVKRVKEYKPEIKIEVETTSLVQVEQALKSEVDIIMLDNMNTKMMREAVNLIDGRAKTEASGNISEETIREVAKTGVDYISSGALTHSVNAFDISQQIKQMK